LRRDVPFPSRADSKVEVECLGSLFSMEALT
jgi:hypothetical protein